MEAYFPILSKNLRNGKGATRTALLKSEASERGRGSTRLKEVFSRGEVSSSNITKGLLNTLADASNPITHSNIADRTEHIVSFATGHQVAEGRRNEIAHTADRVVKLQRQQEDIKADPGGGVLKDTKIYINGYLESTTDIEIKGLVSQAGGQVVFSASQCTHIVTSRALSASKIDRILSRKGRRNSVYVVKPEWVLDSISIGRRRPERTYAIVRTSNTLQNFLES
ncbi:hypothetical protein GALMADRAFT_235869 [Galerina marginata CBS 339.88]|uniref:BRCT domain-containing protein n=1 Tax=Galerina marginata (strain CBS 339.88) TaxID=685588 RepID=A0A067TKC9_GALM3|nr:hypothetical protein GALMADRAFT_235869 [Galerina marginata CBS 339.88]